MSWADPDGEWNKAPAAANVTRAYGWEPGQSYTFVPVACCPRCGAVKVWNTWHQDGESRLHVFQCQECEKQFRTEKKKAGRGVILE